MLRAARLRGEGKSLREIGAEIGVSYQTVLRDLRKWDAEQAQVSHLPVSKLPPGGGNVTPGCDSENAAVLPLRRSS
jgi:hypothetical protein